MVSLYTEFTIQSMCYVCVLSRVWLFVTPWTIAHQAPLSMRFSRQDYWSGLPFPSPGDLPDPRIKPVSPALAGRFFTTELPGKAIWYCIYRYESELTQWCLTLCDLMDLPGSSVHGIFQARILEWVAISFSRGSSRPRDRTHASCIGRQILYHWTTREGCMMSYIHVCVHTKADSLAVL